MNEQDLDLYRRVFVHLGEDGVKGLDAYGARREREGVGAGLLIAGMLVMILHATWPMIEAALKLWWNAP